MGNVVYLVCLSPCFHWNCFFHVSSLDAATIQGHYLHQKRQHTHLSRKVGYSTRHPSSSPPCPFVHPKDGFSFLISTSSFMVSLSFSLSLSLSLRAQPNLIPAKKNPFCPPSPPSNSLHPFLSACYLYKTLLSALNGVFHPKTSFKM